MAQKVRDDKIGALTHSAGNIIMAASVASPAYLTIGGQQYKVTSNLQVALPSLTAHARYQVFAVQSAGVVSLAISQNENSQGPTGYAGWKLIGSLMANAAASVGFGSFLTIKGTPTSLVEHEVDITSATAGFGTLGGTIRSRGLRKGNQFISTAFFTTGTVAAALATYQLNNLTVDSNAVALNNTSGANGPIIGHWGNNATSNSGYLLTATATDATKIYFGGHNGSANILQPSNGNAIAISSAGFSWSFAIPVQGWSNTAIEEL